MPYRCAWGHTSYDPNCDACDAATTDEDSFGKDMSSEMHEAAVHGMTLEEWLDRDLEDEDY